MTIQGITELRKSGHLQEALENALALHSQMSSNYTAGALFWCYNDLYKQQSGEEADDTYNKMLELYQDFGSNEEFMTKAIRRIERNRLPHAQELKKALEQIKVGAAATSIYNTFARLYETKELDEKLFNDFGWLIYYTLKETPSNNVIQRKKMLAQYLGLNLERPSILHSLILSEAVKVERETPLQFRIRDFIRLWDINNLRDEDWEQYRADNGNISTSLVEKLIGVYAEELKTDHVAITEEIDALVNKALHKFPNNQNLPHAKAKILLASGKVDEALKYYRDMIQRFPSKFYLLHQSSELVNDTNTKIGLLCKALSTGTEDNFLGGVRLALANEFLKAGYAECAKYELEKYRETYQNNNWGLKQEFWDAYNRIPAGTNSVADNEIYERYASYADEFIYSDIPSIIVIKVNDNKVNDNKRPGRYFIQWLLRSENKTYTLKKPVRYGLDNRTHNGTTFEIKTLNDKIIWIKPSDVLPSLSWVKTANGTIKLRSDKRGKQYAIIDSVYIPERLLQHIPDGQAVSLLAIKQEDDRWQAITLTKI